MGKPPKSGKEEIKRLEEYLKQKPFWATKEVRFLIKERFERELSEDQVRRILRDKLKMSFSKLYPKDYRRAENAEEVLAGNLETVMRLLEEEGLREEEIAIGFLDESSPQIAANAVRVSKNTERMKSNTIGFYAIRGERDCGVLKQDRGDQ
jgi:hypothetical protein